MRATTNRDVCMVLAGMALDAGLMYIFDPRAGVGGKP